MKTNPCIFLFCSVFLFAGCVWTSDDADDDEGNLSLDNYWGEPAGDNRSLYNEINADLANSSLEELLQAFQNTMNSGDTDDTGGGNGGGQACDDLADCACPIAGNAADIAACYESIDVMTEADCQALLEMYSSYC